ncbi:MAG: transposase [Anaerolineae bacterium]|jgi:putative transposase|nr:transposase [Anaerolineae bacterium]MBT7070704.1 transposase [Anaerolineae bacterium]MBT7323902.1 transposase [Anaerolineae bacterium]
MARTSYKFLKDDPNPYFITSTIVDWLPLFDKPEIAEIILNSLRFLQKENRITLYAYVIMKTHLHLVASGDNLSKEIARFRSFTSRKSIDYFNENGQQGILQQLSQQKLSHRKDREHQFWQEGVQPKRIYDRKMMIQKVIYIHHNPVRKEYVEKPADWLYSSAGDYAGIDSFLDIQIEW